jgi:hypothetical protein
MGLQVEDGKGKGISAEVNSDNHLVTKSIIESEFEFISDVKGEAYSWASGTYDPDAGDTILLIKNTSQTLELHIDTITISTDTETIVQIHLPTTNVTVAGTTITGVNLNTTSGNVASASAARDETGNTQGDIIWANELQATSAPHVVDYGGALILGTNNSVGVDFVSATTACGVSITGHYTDRPS